MNGQRNGLCDTRQSTVIKGALVKIPRTRLRLLQASVLGQISHERTDFYGRFMGGFGRDRCYRMHRKRTVRYMRILQSPYLQGFTLSC